MANKRERAFAWLGVVVFTVSAVALSAAVVIQEIVNRNDASSSSATAKQQSTKTLQGTELAGFTPVSDVAQLGVTDTKVGAGQVVQPGDTVVVDYTGAVAATGIIFQSSLDSGQPVPVTLKSGPGGVIDGWVQGVVGMKVGGQRRLVIPANQAYGPNPPQGSGIPADAALVFDITVRKVGS